MSKVICRQFENKAKEPYTFCFKPKGGKKKVIKKPAPAPKRKVIKKPAPAPPKRKIIKKTQPYAPTKQTAKEYLQSTGKKVKELTGEQRRRYGMLRTRESRARKSY